MTTCAKRFIVGLLACLLSASLLQAQTSFLPATHEVNLTSQDHSFDADTNVIFMAAIATYVYCMYPQYTNHIWSWSHAGSGLQGDYENDEARRTIPFFHDVAVRGAPDVWNMVMTGDDNGAYTSTEIGTWWTAIKAAPALYWNANLGATTNESTVSFPTVHNLPIGGPPEDTAAGGGANQIARNNASTNLAFLDGLVMIDTWHNLWTNGWSTDVVGARKLGFWSGNHLYKAGYLSMALQTIVALGGETNIGSITFDWGAATARSNHCAAASISRVGNTLSATVRWDRMPGAWDPGANQAGCDDTFTVMSYLASQFNWTVQGTNRPAGTYTVNIDGSNVVTLTSAQLAAGWNMFAVTNGPLWAQRVAVLNAKYDQLGVDHVGHAPTHGGGPAGVGGNFDLVNYLSESTAWPTLTGLAYVSDMATHVAGMNALDLLIHNAAQQVPHTFTLTWVPPPTKLPFRKS